MSGIIGVRNNLVELLSAAREPEKNRGLVANFSGRIYDANSLMGRTWRVFYHIITIFTFTVCKQLRANKLRQAILKTEERFHFFLGKHQEAVKLYQHYLEESRKGVVVQDKNYAPCRRRLVEWLNHIHPLLGELKEKKDAISQIWPFDSSKADGIFPDSCAITHLLNLEACLQAPLPTDLFHLIAIDSELTTGQQSKWTDWTDTVNHQQLPNNLLHKAIRAYFEITTNPSHTSAEKIRHTVAKVEIACCNKLYRLFNKGDPNLIAWRKRLKAGDRVEINNKSFTLKSLYGIRKQLDNRKVFKIKERSDVVLVIAKNYSIFGIMQLKQSRYRFPTAEFVQIDCRGSHGLLERIKPLSSVDWQSHEQVMKEDEESLRAIVEFIKLMINTGKMPENFSYHLLGFTTSWKLKLMKVAKERAFNFNLVIDQIIEISKTSFAMFDYLLVNSTLLTLPHAQFYKEVARRAANDNEAQYIIDFLNFGKTFNITDEQVLHRAKKFYEDIRLLFEQLTIEIGNEYKYNEGVLSDICKSCFLKAYNELAGSGVVHGSLSRRLLLDMKTNLNNAGFKK